MVLVDGACASPGGCIAVDRRGTRRPLGKDESGWPRVRWRAICGMLLAARSARSAKLKVQKLGRTTARDGLAWTYLFSLGSQSVWSHGPAGGAGGARTCRIHPDGPRGAPRELGRAARAPRAPQYH